MSLCDWLSVDGRPGLTRVSVIPLLLAVMLWPHCCCFSLCPSSLGELGLALPLRWCAVFGTVGLVLPLRCCAECLQGRRVLVGKMQCCVKGT
jgi:hypothetical protein